MSLCILDGRLWEVWVYRPCLFAAAPRFTVRELKLQQKLIAPPVGNSAKLDCSADGYPTPRVAWYKLENRLMREEVALYTWIGSMCWL